VDHRRPSPTPPPGLATGVGAAALFLWLRIQWFRADGRFADLTRRGLRHETTRAQGFNFVLCKQIVQDDEIEEFGALMCLNRDILRVMRAEIRREFGAAVDFAGVPARLLPPLKQTAASVNVPVDAWKIREVARGIPAVSAYCTSAARMAFR
jgi:hypothetical protein